MPKMEEFYHFFIMEGKAAEILGILAHFSHFRHF